MIRSMRLGCAFRGDGIKVARSTVDCKFITIYVFEMSTKPTEVATKTPPVLLKANLRFDGGGRRLPIYRLAGNSKKVDVETKKPASDGRVFQNVLAKDLSLPSRPQRPEGRLCRLIFQ